MEFYFSLPVWGDKYIELFTSYTLKLLLSDGNLPFLNQQPQVNVRFFVYCNSRDIT